MSIFPRREDITSTRRSLLEMRNNKEGKVKRWEICVHDMSQKGRKGAKGVGEGRKDMQGHVVLSHRSLQSSHCLFLVLRQPSSTCTFVPLKVTLRSPKWCWSRPIPLLVSCRLARTVPFWPPRSQWFFFLRLLCLLYPLISAMYRCDCASWPSWSTTFDLSI